MGNQVCENGWPSDRQDFKMNKKKKKVDFFSPTKRSANYYHPFYGPKGSEGEASDKAGQRKAGKKSMRLMDMAITATSPAARQATRGCMRGDGATESGTRSR